MFCFFLVPVIQCNDYSKRSARIVRQYFLNCHLLILLDVITIYYYSLFLLIIITFSHYLLLLLIIVMMISNSSTFSCSVVIKSVRAAVMAFNVNFRGNSRSQYTVIYINNLRLVPVVKCMSINFKCFVCCFFCAFRSLVNGPQ